MVLMPGFQSTRLATDGALEPFYFLYTDDSIQGNPETCKQSSIMLNYEIKNTLVYRKLFPVERRKFDAKTIVVFSVILYDVFTRVPKSKFFK